MPTSKSRPYTTIDGLAHDAPREYLHQCHPADLVKAILCLRTKNKELCKLVIPARNSSQAKDQSPHSSVSSRKPCESQQGDFPRTIKGVDLANKKVRELKLEVEELKTEIETRAKEADEKANSLVSIEEELQGERAKVEEAEKQRRKTLNELAAAIRTEGNLYDDNHFRGEVETLRRSIDNSWVRNQIWRVVDEQNPSPNFKPYQFLKEVCHNYHEYIYNPIALRTLVHAFVWDVLGREVFGQNIWAQSSKELPGPDGQGSTRNPFSAWQAHIEKLVDDATASETYHDWRVANARLMAKTNSNARTKAVRRVTEDLVYGLVMNLKHIAEDDLDVPGLEDLFHRAVQLDALIQQQRPHYEFAPLFDRGLKFDVETMNFANSEIDPRMQDQPIVKLVVQPRFLKWGNSAGKNYEKGIVLLKGTVD